MVLAHMSTELFQALMVLINTIRSKTHEIRLCVLPTIIRRRRAADWEEVARAAEVRPHGLEDRSLEGTHRALEVPRDAPWVGARETPALDVLPAAHREGGSLEGLFATPALLVLGFVLLDRLGHEDFTRLRPCCPYSLMNTERGGSLEQVGK
jgi:hypothetical protein